jgi:hypothetical protein
MKAQFLERKGATKNRNLIPSSATKMVKRAGIKEKTKIDGPLLMRQRV